MRTTTQTCPFSNMNEIFDAEACAAVRKTLSWKTKSARSKTDRIDRILPEWMITAEEVKWHTSGWCNCDKVTVEELESPTLDGEHVDAVRLRPGRTTKGKKADAPKLEFTPTGEPKSMTSMEVSADASVDEALRETLAFFGQSIPEGYKAIPVSISLDEAGWTRDIANQDNGWGKQVPTPAVTRPIRRIRWNFIPIPPTEVDSESEKDELERLYAVAEAARKNRKKLGSRQLETPRTLVVPLGDWQLHQADADGIEGQVRRIGLIGRQVLEEELRLRKSGEPVGKFLIAGLGDLVEGCDGFYESQAYSVTGHRRSQVKLARRLITSIIDELMAESGLPIDVICVAGNHGEFRKNGKSFTTPGDNDDVAVFEQVYDIYNHGTGTANLEFYIPQDRTNAVIDVQGHLLGLTHGHNFKGGTGAVNKAENFLKNQALAREPIGDSDVLVVGHLHHPGIWDIKSRTLVQIAAMVERSAVFAEQYGLVSRGAGLTTFTMAEGREFLQNYRIHQEELRLAA